MSNWIFKLALLLISSSGIAFAAETFDTSDWSLMEFVRTRTNAVRVTDKPVEMHERISRLCNLPLEYRRIMEKTNASGQPLENPHWKKYAHVYVAKEGAGVMRTNSAVFPRGTIIVKEKFADIEGRKSELFTGMLKREPGYNPTCGDWEFFTMSAGAAWIAERGKIQRCIDCHVEYKSQDYVTRFYGTSLTQRLPSQNLK